MADYEVEIKGNITIADINAQIAGEEAGGSQFVSSKVSTSNGTSTNFATFQELPGGTMPKPLTVVKQGDPQPSGTKGVWSGQMIVEGKSIAVVACRTQ